MAWREKIKQIKALALDLDDVLFPKRDYLLQVYYLYTQFIEFTIHKPPADELLGFLKTEFENNGEDELFEKALKQFPTLESYRENFKRLHHQAQLPLKLFIFPEMKALLEKMHMDGKFIFILTPGDPLMQLNKIRQVEWEGLDQVLKVYFEDELNFTKQNPLQYLLQEHGLKPSELAYIGESVEIIHTARTQSIPIWKRQEIINWNIHE